MNIATLAGICVLLSAVVLLLRQYKPEYAMLVTAAGSGAILVYLLSYIFPVVEEIRTVLQKVGADNAHFSAVFKAVGVCYIAQFAGDICRDFGQTSLAGKVELAGKVSVIALSLPLMKEILQIVMGLLA